MARTRIPVATALLGAALALGLAGGAPAQDADTPLDKALQSVEALISQEKAKPSPDERLLRSLEAIADNLRKERESRGGAKAPGGGVGAPPPPFPGTAGPGDWALNEAKRSFTRGCDLKDDEKALADQIITEFAIDYNLAKANEDEKSKPVIRDHTEKRIGRTFASRDANRMKDNLDGIIRFWDGRWGRGGR